MHCSTFFTTIIISHTYSLSSLCSICLYYSYGIYHAHAVTRLRSKYRQPYLESGLESDAESGLESDVESDAESGLESDAESGLESDDESDVESGLESDVESGLEIDTESGLSTSKCDLVTAFITSPEHFTH